MAQETFGYISLDAEEYVAALFDLSPAHVHEVVTFYTLYFRERPGRHVVWRSATTSPATSPARRGSSPT